MTISENFHRYGYVILRNTFDMDLCSKIAEELEVIHRNYIEMKATHSSLYKLGEWSIKSPHVVSVPMRNFLFSAEYAEICRSLIGPNVDLYWSATAAKPPETGKSFPWHQDGGYGEGPVDYLTCWAALDDVNEDNGCLWALPESHRSGLLLHEFRKTTETEYAGVFAKNVDIPKEQAVPLTLKRGDVICMHSKLLHCSFKNQSPMKRRGLISAFVKAGEYHIEQLRGIPEVTEPFLRDGKVLKFQE